MVGLVDLFVALVLVYAYITTIGLYVYHFSLEDLERKVNKLIDEIHTLKEEVRRKW
jgi:hypothetical protein